MKRLAILALCSALATSAGAAIVAGADPTIETPISGNLYIAGGEVNISAPVGGTATVAGGQVKVTGKIGGNLRAAGGEVTIDAPIEGNATVSAGQLKLGPNARIAGKLKFHGGSFEQDPAAKVVGGVVHSHRGSSKRISGINWFFTGAWTLGLMLLAGLIAGALPGPVKRMEEEVRKQPWLASLFGLLALICIPIAAIAVMVTIIGIPIGLLALLGYVALLVVGYVTASVVVSGLILQQSKSEAAKGTAWRVGAAVVAMLVIASLAHLPVVGGLFAVAALVVGVGAIVAAIVHRRDQSTAAI